MPNTLLPLRAIAAVVSLLPSGPAVRDFLLVLLAWSMLTPTLVLAGAAGVVLALAGAPLPS